MRALIIDEKVRAAIKQLKKHASEHPIAISEVMKNALKGDPDKVDLKLTDFTPDQRKNLAPYIDIPRGYRVAYSIEEQPVGMCAHISISVDKKGKLPSISSVDAICKEFGIDMQKDKISGWVEEFQPGHGAVNVICVLEDITKHLRIQ